MLRFTIYCIFWINLCLGQTNLQQSWGADDGLFGPFYCFTQDSKHRLWAGSYSHGAYMYDGRKWTNFPPGTKSGPLAGHLCEIFEDHEGGLWFNTCGVGFSRYYKNNWNQWISDQPGSENIWQDKDSNIFILKNSNLDTNNTMKKFNFKSNEFTFLNHPILQKLRSSNNPRDIKYIYGTNDYMVITRKDRSYTYSFFLQGKFQKNWIVPFYNLNITHFLCNNSNPSIDKNAKVRLVFSGKNNIIVNEGIRLKELETPKYPIQYGDYIKKPKLSKFLGSTFKAETNSIFSLWQIDEMPVMKTQRYLLIEYDAATMNQVQILIIQSGNFDNTLMEINAFKDTDGNYWVSDQTDIIRIFPDQTIVSNKITKLPSSTWAGTQSIKGQIWLASYGMGLWVFDGYQIYKAAKKFDKFTNFDDGAFVDKKGNIYFNLEGSSINYSNSFGGLLKISPKKSADYDILSPYVNGYIVGEDKYSNIIRGVQLKGLWILPSNKDGRDSLHWKKIDRRQGLALDHIKCFLHDHQNRYWMGEPTKGFAMYDPSKEKVYNWLLTDYPQAPEVMSIDEDHWGFIWLGTRRGLFCISPNRNVQKNWKINEEMVPVAQEYTGTNDIINTCKIYNDSLLFFGNSKGAFILNLAQYHRGNVNVISLDNISKNKKVLLMQNASFQDHQGNIWWLNSQGARSFNPKSLPQYTKAPEPIIRWLNYGADTVLISKNNLSLPTGRYSVKIGYTSSFGNKLCPDIKYQYRLIPVDTVWCELTQNEMVEWDALITGNYTFEIKALRNGSVSPIKRLKFKINPPILSDPRLYVSGFILTLFGALFWFYNYKKSKEKEITIQKIQSDNANLSKEKNQLQVEAIASQLSPHFINNPLHWLSIRSESDKDVVSVVDKLSRNINHIFKLSSEGTPYHYLSEELEFCENYLLIEKTRDPDLFDFKISSLEATERLMQIKIPLLCIQIHVENAVERGIRKIIGRKGRIDIRILSMDSNCEIHIVDNGIGRNKSNSLGNHGFQKGTRMINKLVEVYNSQNKNKIIMLYEDDIFSNNIGESYGTRVILKIPYDYNFEI